MKVRIVKHTYLSLYKLQRLSKIWGWVDIIFGTKQACEDYLATIKAPNYEMKAKKGTYSVIHEEEI